MKDIHVRPAELSDKSEWLRMRQALWPNSEPHDVDRFFQGEAKEPELVLVAELNGQLHGFAELSIRAYAEGCATDHVAYVEGLYVDPNFRKQGVSRTLIEAGETWALSRGCVEFASDAKLENELSARVHERLGFQEVGEIRCFRKPLA